MLTDVNQQNTSGAGHFRNEICLTLTNALGCDRLGEDRQRGVALSSTCASTHYCAECEVVRQAHLPASSMCGMYGRSKKF
eukprot:2335565-Amphidinium_carterae.2